MHQKKVFLVKNGHFGVFLALKVPRGRETHPKKRVNDKVSGIWTCKFEFSTIKSHYNDIQNGILDKHQKSPKRGVFCPKRAPRAHPRVIPDYR